ncbi:MAG TPA: hypothetical protein VF933_13055 [Streptosporangiaceae bacterium]
MLSTDRSVIVQATIDTATVPGDPVEISSELLDGSRRLASTAQTVTLTAPGRSVATLTLTSVGNVALWSPASPKLYLVRVTVRWTKASAGLPHAGLPHRLAHGAVRQPANEGS